MTGELTTCSNCGEQVDRTSMFPHMCTVKHDERPYRWLGVPADPYC